MVPPLQDADVFLRSTRIGWMNLPVSSVSLNMRTLLSLTRYKNPQKGTDRCFAIVAAEFSLCWEIIHSLFIGGSLNDWSDSLRHLDSNNALSSLSLTMKPSMSAERLMGVWKNWSDGYDCLMIASIRSSSCTDSWPLGVLMSRLISYLRLDLVLWMVSFVLIRYFYSIFCEFIHKIP